MRGNARPEVRANAFEIDPERLATLEREVAERGYSNIEVVRASPTDSRRPRDIEFVFICNAYHHFVERATYFKRLHQHLAPEARLAIVDGKSEGAATWFLPDGHWLEPGQLNQELEGVGYAHTASYDFLPVQSFDRFVREQQAK